MAFSIRNTSLDKAGVENTAYQLLTQNVIPPSFSLAGGGTLALDGPTIVEQAQLHFIGLLANQAGNGNVTLGPDTAANAKQFMDRLGLTSQGVGARTILRFAVTDGGVGSNVFLQNTSGTFANVAVTLFAGGLTNSVNLFEPAAATATSVSPGVALVAVVADDITPGSERVVFTVLTQPRPAA